VQPVEGRRIVVTGAGGFIGTRVIAALVERCATVSALVGPPGYQHPPLPRKLAKAAYGWIDDPASLASLVERADTIIHLAGPASVAASFQSPIDYLRAHVLGTAVAAAACRNSEIQRFVYVSSAEVYGQPDQNPVTEGAALQPRSPYAAAKVGAEAVLRSYASTYGYSLTVLRPFSIYGPDSRPNSVVGTILDCILKQQPIVLRDLRPVRDYCYLDDLVEAILLSCTVTLTAECRIFNIGSQTRTSVAKLAKTAIRIAGVDLPVSVSCPDRPAGIEILELISDSTRAAEELGWRAQTSLNCGLQKTLAWLREQRARQ
jgi:nucleoside-diphosphate-sugar epimerase